MAAVDSFVVPQKCEDDLTCVAIKRNNERDWFTRNKQRYLDEVRDPVCQFIADFGPTLEKIGPRLVADPRPVGGSMIRIFCFSCGVLTCGNVSSVTDDGRELGNRPAATTRGSV